MNVHVRLVPPAVTTVRSYPATSEYVRHFWVPVLGPTSVLLGIALTEEVERALVVARDKSVPVIVDAALLAARCGVAEPQIAKSLARLTSYGFGLLTGYNDGSQVIDLPSRWPELNPKQVRRLDRRLQARHGDYLFAHPRGRQHSPVGPSAALAYCSVCDMTARRWRSVCPGEVITNPKLDLQCDHCGRGLVRMYEDPDDGTVVCGKADCDLVAR